MFRLVPDRDDESAPVQEKKLCPFNRERGRERERGGKRLKEKDGFSDDARASMRRCIEPHLLPPPPPQKKLHEES